MGQLQIIDKSRSTECKQASIINEGPVQQRKKYANPFASQ